MLAMSRGALTAAQAETYYEEKYSRDDYYTEEQRVAGQWFGRGAEELGLSGEVVPEDFRAVLRGVDPGCGAVLVQKANGYDDRRAGWDATFNAPKSVSVQALVGGDRRLTDAHRQAVSRALWEIEQYALSRRRGGSEWVVTGNAVAARFDHIAARPAGGADDGFGPDPHLHTHVVIANMTLRPDGEWRGVDPIEIYRSQSFATAVYRSELAREVQKLGYEIRIAGRDGRWELEGYTREQVMAFSRRRQDIEQTLTREGLSGAAAAQTVAHRTRLAKDHRDEQSLKAEWRSRADEYEIDVDHHVSHSRARGPIQPGAGRNAEEAIRHSIAENSEREAVIDRRTIEATALQHAMGNVELGQVRAETEHFEQTGQLVAVGSAANSPRGAYTTPEMIALERENIELMSTGQGRASAIGQPDEIRQWANQRGLLPDQAAVAEQTLSSNDWITSIEGRAGAAKTTTVGAIREFAEQQGYSVQGFAPTTRAVKSLSEAGVSARTVAGLLEAQTQPHDAKQIWIVDESSLLPTRQVNRLLHRAKEEGVGQIIFVGDQRQHHAIEAGRPIHQMQDAGMVVARLDTIRRQRDPELREAVSRAANGQIAESLSILHRRGDIHEVGDFDERRSRIARDYVTAQESGQRVLVVSPANEERRKLNEAIRAELISRGHVAPAGQEHTILVNRGLSGSQRAMAYNYDEGDVLRFTRGSKPLKIAKGDYARIDRIDRISNSLTISTAAGRSVTYNPVRLFGVEAFREERRILARGDRIQFRAPERALGIANGEFALITALDDRKVTLRLDSSKELTVARNRLRHIDHGYASTSHSAQGATVDRVIVNIDTQLSAELVNRKQFYVSISRARNSLAIYTNDQNQLARAVSRSREKSTAIQHSLNPRQAFAIVPDGPRASISPARSITSQFQPISRGIRR
jgi:conjugative relaxase-like TrwC/TraI family protein